jgi:hypothetical protein
VRHALLHHLLLHHLLLHPGRHLRGGRLEAELVPLVAVGLYWGNYSSAETPQQGQVRAWDFYNNGLRQVDPTNFPELPGYKSDLSKNMRFLGESSSRRSINSVRVELYFIYDKCKVASPTTT